MKVLKSKEKQFEYSVKNMKMTSEDNFEKNLINFHQHVMIKLKGLQKNKHNYSEGMAVTKDILADNESFPNVIITFRIYLTMPCSICGGAR